jgi:hypothetical protein
MDEGWVYYSYAMENDGWLQFAGIKRIGAGYVAQHIERRLEKSRKQ